MATTNYDFYFGDHAADQSHVYYVATFSANDVPPGTMDRHRLREAVVHIDAGLASGWLGYVVRGRLSCRHVQIDTPPGSSSQTDRPRDEVFLAVVNSQWQPSVGQDRCWRKSDLSEPYPKGIRGFESV